jgi:hypothetical protein
MRFRLAKYNFRSAPAASSNPKLQMRTHRSAAFCITPTLSLFKSVTVK